jgi:hypothetical protein
MVDDPARSALGGAMTMLVPPPIIPQFRVLNAIDEHVHLMDAPDNTIFTFP